MTIDSKIRVSAITQLSSGGNLVWAPFLKLLWTIILALTAVGAQAGVVFTDLYSFTNTAYGLAPDAALVQGSDGYFYGTTAAGGTNGYGTVFKISITGDLTSLHTFTGTNDGHEPEAGLVQGNDGYFYGTTWRGGTNNLGTVFKISTNGVLTSLYSITGGNDGAHPIAGLAQGSDGNFYGTASGGGTNGIGTVFEISTNGILTNLHSFMGGGEGASPYAGLVLGNDGIFYGTTLGGGTNGFGTVFAITTNATLTTLYSFGAVTNSKGQPLDGSYPIVALVQGRDGDFYGTTSSGGAYGYGEFSDGGYGTLFKISTNAVLTTLYSFGAITNANDYPLDGSYPNGLVQGSDGDFYGTTDFGGAYGYVPYALKGNGTVFKISTNGVLTSLYSFTYGDDGAYPRAGLVQGGDGNFYGTAANGGSQAAVGTVFRVTVVPEPPPLTISLFGTNVVLAWPTFGAGFTLEWATNLSSPTIWNTNSITPVLVSGQTIVTNPISGPQMFFRLVSQ